jgi:hypothetical protein
MDEPHTPNDEYIAMMVVGFGCCVALPLLCLVWALLGYNAVWTEHEWREFSDYVVDAWHLSILRDKKYIKAKRRRKLSKKNVKHFDKVFIWMHTYEHLKDTQFKISLNMAREICNLISTKDDARPQDDYYI